MHNLYFRNPDDEYLFRVTSSYYGCLEFDYESEKNVRIFIDPFNVDEFKEIFREFTTI